MILQKYIWGYWSYQSQNDKWSSSQIESRPWKKENNFIQKTLSKCHLEWQTNHIIENNLGWQEKQFNIFLAPQEHTKKEVRTR